MEIIQAYATKNRCYQIGSPLRPQGIMLHSVGCAQPSAAVFARSFNQYQPGGQSVCVHAFVQADGTVYQLLPWEMRGWHCGGSANSTHIGVEMTEPSAGMTYAEAAEQIAGTYRTAEELFAALCKQYGLDPEQDGVIIGHAEGHRRGVASNHADPELLWRTYDMGYTMDGFRRDVAAAMAAKNTDEEDEDDMVKYKTIDDVPEWYRSEVQELMDAGALKGTGNGAIDISEDVVRGAIIGMRYVKAQTPHYHSIDDMPEYYRKEAQKLVDRGALRGVGGGDLNVSEDALRTMIVCQRMVDNAKEGKA